MQTKEGSQAQAPVSSELAAMFTHAILPTLRSHYYNPNKPGMGWRDYEDKCQEFAERIGLPEDEWYRVTIPCFFSLDWDTRHTWVRQYIAMPGRGADHLAAFDELTFTEKGITKSQPCRPPEAAFDLNDALDPAKRALQLQMMKSLREVQQSADERETFRADFYKAENYDMVHHARWKKSISDNNFLTVLPQQFMPLSKVSADIHSTVEHMVGTIKGEVRRLLLASDFGDAELWKGRTYQSFVNKAVASRGNGAKGKHHIGKSTEKQRIICRILAAEKGFEFDVRYTFGVPSEKKKKWHTVCGTAGGWIRDTKWT